jgi:hypothetical protein
MALITCPECQQPASDRAASCPTCGFPFGSTSASNEQIKRTPSKQFKSAKPKSRILPALAHIGGYFFVLIFVAFATQEFPFLLALVALGLVGLVVSLLIGKPRPIRRFVASHKGTSILPPRRGVFSGTCLARSGGSPPPAGGRHRAKSCGFPLRASALPSSSVRSFS